MAFPILVEVGEYSRPVLTFAWTNQDEGTLDDPTGIVNITGYSFEMKVVRKTNPALGDETTTILVDLAGAIAAAASGTFTFTLTAAHTGLPPGDYRAELLVWTSGATTNPPHHRKTFTYRVRQALERP